MRVARAFLLVTVWRVQELVVAKVRFVLCRPGLSRSILRPQWEASGGLLEANERPEVEEVEEGEASALPVQDQTVAGRQHGASQRRQDSWFQHDDTCDDSRQKANDYANKQMSKQLMRLVRCNNNAGKVCWITVLVDKNTHSCWIRSSGSVAFPGNKFQSEK